jgi:hypothetical protein
MAAMKEKASSVTSFESESESLTGTSPSLMVSFASFKVYVHG